MVESSAPFHEPDQGHDLPAPPPLAEDDLNAEAAPSTPDEAGTTEGEQNIATESSVEPEVEPAPEPEPMPAALGQPSADPAVATTLHVPASGESVDGEGGGEWELLRSKVLDWLSRGDLQRQLQQYAGLLKLLAGFVGLLLLLRIYAALVGAIESLPLVPGLLELVGLIWLSRYVLTKLVRSSDRQTLLASWREGWASFRGKP